MININNIFKALSDPTRREILNLLRIKDLTAGEIHEYFDMKKSSISHHLTILKNADLVDYIKEGQYIIYSLNTTVFQDIITWFFHFKEKEEDIK